MHLKGNKGGKKNKLEGAINEEISDGIMSDFIHNIKHDKNDENEASKNNKEVKRSMKEEILNSKYSGSLPVIRNTNKKEWWISLAAFGTVVLLVFLLIFLPFTGKPDYQLKLTTKAIESGGITGLSDNDSFNIGEPVYVYFSSNKSLKIKKILIQVQDLNTSSEDRILSTLESRVNPNWKNVETHFQKEYFEIPGKYQIKIQDEAGSVLAEKTFFIR